MTPPWPAFPIIRELIRRLGTRLGIDVPAAIIWDAPQQNCWPPNCALASHR
ncbi:acyl carrier protein [Nocardia amamiensis]|uniref:Acyl carrier protein n=1 Tax=Nocardia amamiensis TaxID=404578 RepID=A0ABS0D021_9NOCA|nr:acyl carrier protein [Nocardia amamiensis]MBF6300464.1 acyl carrier protein [Nocardia amamiensis]